MREPGRRLRYGIRAWVMALLQHSRTAPAPQSLWAMFYSPLRRACKKKESEGEAAPPSNLRHNAGGPPKQSAHSAAQRSTPVQQQLHDLLRVPLGGRGKVQRGRAPARVHGRRRRRCWGAPEVHKGCRSKQAAGGFGSSSGDCTPTPLPRPVGHPSGPQCCRPQTCWRPPVLEASSSDSPHVGYVDINPQVQQGGGSLHIAMQGGDMERCLPDLRAARAAGGGGQARRR